MPRDVACVVLIIELLPMQSDLTSIVKWQTIVVAGVLDSAGTYRSAVLLFKLVSLLVGYTKFSFYQGIVVPGSFGLTGARDGRLVDAQSAGCCSL